MELLDRYLKAVAQGLPAEQREDIIRELFEDIRSEMEDKEAELRRPLTPAEQEAILKQHGNPLVLAGRYRQDHRSVAFGPQLIGPVVFPFYIKVLSFNLGLTFTIIATIFTALAIGGQRITLHDIFSTVFLQLFIQLSVVTLIFTMIEKHLNKYPDKWKLGGIGGGVHLDLKSESGVHLGGAKEARHVSRFESISLIVAPAVALVWLAEVQRHPFLIFGPAAYFLKLSPIWYQAYPAILLLTLFGMVRATINLIRPDWVQFRAVAQLFIDAASLVLIYFLLKAGDWVYLTEIAVADASESPRARAVEIVNQLITYGLSVSIVINAVQITRKIILLARGRRGPTSVPGADVEC